MANNEGKNELSFVFEFKEGKKIDSYKKRDKGKTERVGDRKGEGEQPIEVIFGLTE